MVANCRAKLAKPEALWRGASRHSALAVPLFPHLLAFVDGDITVNRQIVEALD
jgi:hypothetical protein